MTDPMTLATRYRDVWNAPDHQTRSAGVTALWTPDAVHYTDTDRFAGHAAILDRIAGIHRRTVEPTGRRFRIVDEPVGHSGAVAFTAELTVADREPGRRAAVFLHTGPHGRITADHHFGRPAEPSADTRAAVNEFLRRSAAGDPDRIADCYATEVDWRVNWPVDTHSAVPWIRPRRTRADVADHFRVFTALCEGDVSVDGIDVDGPHAVLTGTSRQRVRATGRGFAMRFALRLTVVDGLITRHHMYEDSQAVLAAFA